MTPQLDYHDFYADFAYEDAPESQNDDGLSDSEQVERACEVRRPQSKLDPRIAALNPDSRNFPLLRFGFAFSEEKLLEVARKDQLKLFPVDSNSPFLTGVAERYLWSKCGDLILTPFEVVWPLLTTGECMISLFTTNDLRRVGKLKKCRVREALNILRKELGLGDQRAFWYWDFACGPGYTCPLPEYNLAKP